MKKTQILVLGCLLTIILTCYLPVTIVNADGDTTDLTPGGKWMINLGDSSTNTKGTFTATGSVIAWIANTTIGSSPPPYALWNKTGTSGNWSIDLNQGTQYFLVFYNAGISTVQITYNLEEPRIPGFQLIYIIFGLLALSILVIKKKSLF